ncbi:hypothetical protein ABH931_001830 [Streptacidiphilus sp. MAP12-33]|uniref:hypothetical protein n=1 Tax=Streptacidiphilus sp. MAP12-33 TaxID=3156266 RepID=UPI003511C76B
MFEDRLARSLRETGEELAPRDLTGLVNGGVADGRKRRRRRNTAVVGGSAALALVAVGGALVPSLLSTAKADGVAGPAARPSMSLTAHAKPAAGPDRSAQMIDTLKRLLPGGAKITDASGRWYLPGGQLLAPNAALVYDDGHGASQIEVELTHNPPNATNQPGCANPAYTPNDVCHTYRLPGGGRLLIDQGYEYPAKGTGTKDWHATLIKADGSQIDVDEWNSAAEKGSPVTRATPPLSAGQLRTLVTSTAWQPLLAALPVPKPVRAPGGYGPDGATIVKTINMLLPRSVRGLHADTEDGYAQEQLADGHFGVGLIGVNVQHFDPNDPSLISQLYSGATVLPDGSRLAVRQEPAEKGGSGAVQWVVDLLRPSGERVVAMEFNAPRQGAAADRAQPVLSIEELRVLVTNPVWTKLG